MKKFIFLASVLSIIILGISYVYYNKLTTEAITKINQNYELTKNELLVSAKESVKSKNLFLFEKISQNIQKRTNLKDVKIIIKKHILNDKLFLDSIFSLDSSWKILEVSIDVKDGSIQSLSEGKYEITLNTEDQSLKQIVVRFQAIKDNIIKDFLFSYEIEKEIKIEKNTIKNLKNTIINEDEFTLAFDYDININKENILNDIYTFFFSIFIVMISLLILVFLINSYFIRPKFIGAINALNIYLKNILEGKVIKDSSIPKISFTDLNQLHTNIIELTKKYVNSANELAIKKDIIHQKERTDELTGLPNKKSFENDLKYMFISNKKGYIIQLRIDKIGIHSQNHGSEIVDSLIEDFSHTIKKYFHSNTKTNNTIYRFFSGEFAMIMQEEDSVKIEDTLQEIMSLTKMLSDKYYFFDNAVYYGAIPFDQYGTIESIQQSAQDAFQIAFKEKTTKYYIADTKNQLEVNQKLENTVKDIIARNDFVIQYLHDTYSLDAKQTLLMQEVAPLIIDSFTYESIPSGKFISVAEKLGYISDFDKALVEKILEQIELGEITHKICVMLSVISLSDQLFLLWLSDILKTNAYSKQLVFVSPSYSVASNYEVFLKFSELLEEVKHDFMIKRYDPLDLPLKKLEKLQPSYVRLERTLCQDFKKDSTKQHVVKQIVMFADDHNIKVLSDSVKKEQDLTAFEMLGLYGTSK